MKKMTTCLWFDSNAEEAVKFYASVFKNMKILKTTRMGKEGFEIHGRPENSILTISFELNGQEFMVLNGGAKFKFNESISFVINCETQEEIDNYWNKLSANKEAEACGWLKDKYGLSWQIVPTILMEMLSDKVTKKTESVMHALLQMKKLDIKKLKQAYDQA